MRDLQFDDMHLFARVAELGTLSAVARERDVPVSQVSRSLSRIEKACGARLIHRSTHGLSLTVEGHAFRDYCARMIDTLDELEGEFASKTLEASGLVRVAASTVTSLNQWPFAVKGKPSLFNAQGHWRTNDTNMAATMVLQGLGIGRLATLVGDALVKQKLLAPVLEKFVDPGPVPVYAVTAGARHRLPKIKACIDYWAEWFGKPAAGSSKKR